VPGADILAATINALHANIAILDQDGSIIAVNDKWRVFGSHRNAVSDCVGLNYLGVCATAAGLGDTSAARVEAGLRRLLHGEARTFGYAYTCAERTFRMSARRLGDPFGGIIVAHEDITALVNARRQRDLSRRSLSAAEQKHVAEFSHAYEELGQRLAAISLAAQAIEQGGDAVNAIALIYMAVDEARHELRAMRYGEAQHLKN
jgi:two-component system, NarL family, sensor kinase